MSNQTPVISANLDQVREKLASQAEAAARARDEQKQRETQELEPPVAARWASHSWRILFFCGFALTMLFICMHFYSTYMIYSRKAFRLPADQVYTLPGSDYRNNVAEPAG